MKHIKNYEVKAGKSWHWRKVMQFNDGTYDYNVESRSIFIKLMMQTNCKLLHKLALFLVYDYEIAENWSVEKGKGWKK